MAKRNLPCSCAVLLLPSLAFAGVHRVGPGAFSTPQAAVDAAIDGDTILIAPGNYPGFKITDEALAIAVDPSGIVNCGAVVVESLSSAKNVLVDGLNVTAASGMALKLHSNLGSVRIQNCTLTGASSVASNPGIVLGAGAFVTGCGDVVMRNTTILGGGGYSDWGASSGTDALFARGSNLALYGCTVRGGYGGWADPDSSNWGGSGGDGLESPDSFVLAQQTTFTGGAGGGGGDGDFLSPGGGGGAGGHGVHLRADTSGTSPEVVTRACNLSGGSGGMGGFWGGPWGVNGLPAQVSVGVVRTPVQQDLLNVTTPTRWPIGTMVPITVSGPVGSTVALLIGPDTVFVQNPSTDYALHVPGPFYRRLAIGVVPASGSIQLNVLVPSPPGGVSTQAWQLQALNTGASSGPTSSLATAVLF
ncbi:MAG TPA: hypothetical protein VM509_06145 [Planctomycetota bacterium]|nr:hypothetical protein [Planctomycetota bacterium]